MVRVPAPPVAVREAVDRELPWNHCDSGPVAVPDVDLGVYERLVGVYRAAEIQENQVALAAVAVVAGDVVERL